MSRIRFPEVFRGMFRPGKEKQLQLNARQAADRALHEFLAAPEQHIERSISPNQHFPDFQVSDLIGRSSGERIIRLDGIFVDEQQQLQEGSRWFVVTLAAPSETPAKQDKALVFRVVTGPRTTRLDMYVNQVPYLSTAPPVALSLDIPYPIEHAEQVFRLVPIQEALGKTEVIHLMSGMHRQVAPIREPSAREKAFIPGLIQQR